MDEQFKKDDYVLIHASRGQSIGTFEINYIKSIKENNLELLFPLEHSYSNDQVVRIPQYSVLTIEEGVTLFTKQWDGMLGGVIAFMCNKGLIMKGTIGSHDSSEKVELVYTDNKKSKAGIIGILANYKTQYARKVADIKSTNSFLTVTIPEVKRIQLPNTGITITNPTFQHLTIPPNLDLHLTKGDNSGERIWYSALRTELTKKGKLRKDYVKIATIVLPPISTMPVFTARQYGAALIVGLTQLPHWNANTGFVIELFAQNSPYVTIPKNAHYKGELGTLLPFKYSEMAKTYKEDYKQGDFFIKPFVITNHEAKSADEIIIYFGEDTK